MPASFPAARITDIAGSAEWLAHRYDPAQDAVQFVPVPRAVHRATTFLTDEYLPADLAPVAIRRGDAVQARDVAAPLHFIIHSAFCCSTLLARAFDRQGWAMGLKEPVVLNDLIGWRRRRDAGPDMAAVLDDLLTLLARPFSSGESVVVKPSTVANALAPAILTLRPATCAVLLYAPLETFLASVAKKGLEGRLWVRTLLLGMMDDGLAQFGYPPREQLGHTDLQVAALGWLGQQMLFADLVARFGAGRVRTLDSATLMARPAEAMHALARLFALPHERAIIDQIVAGPAFTSHSKFGQAFDAGARAAEHRAAHDAHGEEIGVVTQWAGRVAETMGIPLVPPAALLVD